MQDAPHKHVKALMGYLMEVYSPQQVLMLNF